MEETLTLRDKLDAIEACDRLIAYYKEQLQDANKRPINMGDDIYELEMTDDEKDRLDDMEYCRKKIVATMEAKKRLVESLEDDYTFKIATGRRQHPFSR